MHTTPTTPHRSITAAGHMLADMMMRKPMREHVDRNMNMTGILDVTLKEMYVSYTSSVFFWGLHWVRILVNGTLLVESTKQEKLTWILAAHDMPYQSISHVSIVRSRLVEILLTAMNCYIVVWNPELHSGPFVPLEVAENMVVSSLQIIIISFFM